MKIGRRGRLRHVGRATQLPDRRFVRELAAGGGETGGGQGLASPAAAPRIGQRDPALGVDQHRQGRAGEGRKPADGRLVGLGEATGLAGQGATASPGRSARTSKRPSHSSVSPGRSGSGSGGWRPSSRAKAQRPPAKATRQPARVAWKSAPASIRSASRRSASPRGGSGAGGAEQGRADRLQPGLTGGEQNAAVRGGLAREPWRARPRRGGREGRPAPPAARGRGRSAGRDWPDPPASRRPGRAAARAAPRAGGRAAAAAGRRRVPRARPVMAPIRAARAGRAHRSRASPRSRARRPRCGRSGSPPRRRHARLGQQRVARLASGGGQSRLGLRPVPAQRPPVGAHGPGRPAGGGGSRRRLSGCRPWSTVSAISRRPRSSAQSAASCSSAMGIPAARQRHGHGRAGRRASRRSRTAKAWAGRSCGTPRTYRHPRRAKRLSGTQQRRPERCVATL